MSDPAPRAVLVIGVGNELRGDDAVGIDVARRVRALAPTPVAFDVAELQDEPTRLLDVWAGRRAVLLVDTMRSGAPPGTVARLNLSSDAPAAAAPAPGSASTHALGLDEVIALARTLGRLPPTLIVYAVEGRGFALGDGRSEPVAAAVATVAETVLAEAMALDHARIVENYGSSDAVSADVRL